MRKPRSTCASVPIDIYFVLSLLKLRYSTSIVLSSSVSLPKVMQHTSFQHTIDLLESGLLLSLTVLRPSDCKYVCLCDGVGGPEDDNPVHPQQRSVCCWLKMQAQRVIKFGSHGVHESLCAAEDEWLQGSSTLAWGCHASSVPAYIDAVVVEHGVLQSHFLKRAIAEIGRKDKQVTEIILRTNEFDCLHFGELREALR